MKSKFITDPLDTADGFPSTAWAEVSTNFLPSAGHGGGNPLALAPVEIFYSPTFSSGPVVSPTSPTTPSNVVTITSGGITFKLTYDTAAMSAPTFRAGIEQAASMLAATISDKITVDININCSGTGGGAFAGPQYGFLESYSTIRADLINNATQGDTTFDKLPTGPTFQGQSNVAVWSSELKLFGLLSATDTAQDGSATFATDISQNLLVGVALHDLPHALGRVPYGPEPDIFDFFRFTSLGNRLILGGATAPAAYFSVDGGNTKLADFGQNSDASDFLNSGVQGPNDPYNEFYTSNTLQSLTTVDKQLLDALGFHVFTPVTTVIEAFGFTKLVQVGNNYFLDSISTGTGPELKYQGVPIVAGQWGAWAPIGAEATATGYEVAWKVTGADQYTVWNTDTNGNDTINTIGTVSGSSPALEALETSFHQDLNGDGVIGPPAGTTVIESFGSTSLVQVGNHFFLESNTTGIGPALKYQGVPIVAGQWGAWAPIGAEATATGYEVAWKVTGADQYTVWNTDTNGNDPINTIGTVSGSSPALEALETSFHQALNGDGVIGPPAGTKVIESFGSTSLVQGGNHFFFESTRSE